MPPPRTTLLFLQLPHTPSLTSSPHTVHRSCYHGLTRSHGTATRPTRSQYQRRQAQYSIYLFLLQAHTSAFSTSTSARKEPNYYEILDVPITASSAEIKKKFYALSLRHHPDRNKDPSASHHFARISSAYSILSNAQKRNTYDREHGFHRAHAHAHAHAPTHATYPHGSHSSHSANLHQTGYAGSRPASGLSNRKGTFRGPPPSFYEQGGYGATGRKGEGYAAGKAGPSDGGGGGAGFGFGAGSTHTHTNSTGQRYEPDDPLGFIDRNPLGHFNARGHFRTQKAEDARRRERVLKARRAARETDSAFAGGNFGLVRFVVVCGTLGVAGVMGLVQWSGDGKKKRKGGGSVLGSS